MDRFFVILDLFWCRLTKHSTQSCLFWRVLRASFGAALHQLEKIFGAQNLKNSPWVKQNLKQQNRI